MLATFIIGLREGLEAALIVGIIAAFLRRNGVSLRPMWIGVVAAVLLSLAVGVTLSLVEQALPQAEQEALEAIIGAVAVVFVTGMILWMRRNSRGLKTQLESEAAHALSTGHGYALAAMAFLAVLKEGFETSVFLLATFSASTSATAAAIGATAGILTSIGLGCAIFVGGVRLNLSRFFTWTGVFLVLVAAGLVVTTLRTAHEAGWITIGQQPTVDLSWLAPSGSVRGALIAGVLGIPADPRRIEVLGWFCYLIPVLAISLWPVDRNPAPSRVPRIRLAIAAALTLGAAVLAVSVPSGSAALPTTAPLTGRASSATVAVDGDAARLTVTGSSASNVTRFNASSQVSATHDQGVTADRWSSRTRPSAARRPASLTLDQLRDLFGRIPVGISVSQNPGPFKAEWDLRRDVTVWTVEGGLLDARQRDRAVLVLTGGGLNSSRVLTLDATTWSVPAANVAARATTVSDAVTNDRERQLWRVWLPLAMVIAALTQVALALRDRRRLRSVSPTQDLEHAQSDPPATAAPEGQPRPSRSSLNVP